MGSLRLVQFASDGFFCQFFKLLYHCEWPHWLSLNMDFAFVLNYHVCTVTCNSIMWDLYAWYLPFTCSVIVVVLLFFKMVLILLHWKKRQISCKETQYRRFSIKRRGRLFQIWNGGPGIFYTASTDFFLPFPFFFVVFLRLSLLLLFSSTASKTSAMIRFLSLLSMLCCYYRND